MDGPMSLRFRGDAPSCSRAARALAPEGQVHSCHVARAAFDYCCWSYDFMEDGDATFFRIVVVGSLWSAAEHLKASNNSGLARAQNVLAMDVYLAGRQAGRPPVRPALARRARQTPALV